MSVGAVHLARDYCLAPERVDAPVHGGRYGRLFPNLPALAADEGLLHALGRPVGPCDNGPGTSEGRDSAVAAVWPFFGQFVAHDITADRSPVGQRADPARIRNFRTPKANLEGVYGSGPAGSPYLYAGADPARLLLGPGGHDLPRNQEGLALVGDPRNDVHLFMNQLQVAFIGLHNRLVDRLREDGTPEPEVFEDARRAATWHYQHVILREFLPSLVGAELTAELLNGGARLYVRPEEPYIPFEFADAAYRYGHSQIRQRYQVNAAFGPVPVFPDLLGFGPVAAEHAVDWPLLVDVPGRPAAQRAKRIDGRLPASLIALPTQITGELEGSDYASLANRDLERGQTVGLPSGEAFARALGVQPLDSDEVGLAAYGWRDETPLWFYVLKETEALRDGNRLGPVGGRIVGEVLVGIVDADPESFRSVEPTWWPTLPARTPGRFGLADILVPGNRTVLGRAGDSPNDLRDGPAGS
jgi:Animal haem peroxidase